MSKSTSIIGRWRITEMDNWDQEAVDLVQPGFIEFDDDGLGSLGFSASAVDLMIAATAAHHGLTVLHDDADYRTVARHAPDLSEHSIRDVS